MTKLSSRLWLLRPSSFGSPVRSSKTQSVALRWSCPSCVGASTDQQYWTSPSPVLTVVSSFPGTFYWPHDPLQTLWSFSATSFRHPRDSHSCCSDQRPYLGTVWSVRCLPVSISAASSLVRAFGSCPGTLEVSAQFLKRKRMCFCRFWQFRTQTRPWGNPTGVTGSRSILITK